MELTSLHSCQRHANKSGAPRLHVVFENCNADHFVYQEKLYFIAIIPGEYVLNAVSIV